MHSTRAPWPAVPGLPRALSDRRPPEWPPDRGSRCPESEARTSLQANFAQERLALNPHEQLRSPWAVPPDHDQGVGQDGPRNRNSVPVFRPRDGPAERRAGLESACSPYWTAHRIQGDDDREFIASAIRDFAVPAARTDAVMGVPGPRELYSRLEEILGPPTTALAHSGEFAQIVAFLGDARSRLRRKTVRWTARGWHVLNLPAGTDVQRLRTQLGSLDRDVRMLTLELERQRREANRRGDSGAQHS